MPMSLAKASFKENKLLTYSVDGTDRSRVRIGMCEGNSSYFSV